MTGGEKPGPDPRLQSEDPFSPDELAAWHGFLVSHASLTRRLDATTHADHGLSLVQFDVLVNLRIAGGELRMSELADRVPLSRTGLVRLIDELVRRDWLERKPDPADARATLARLTRKGHAKARSAAASHRANVRAYFLAPLSGAQRAALAQSWTAIAENLAAAEPPPATARRSPASAVRRRRGRAA